MYEDVDICFQIEIVNGEPVYACNVCHEGFDDEENDIKHIAINHKDNISHVILMTKQKK